ncbi:Non-hem dioxygenase N-terminal domain [Dillenia turbinata]|uniref:Non-hem dioxygenase N-terminal domain n=1 Tax=Dillenia turbinata TaxID=194707 RepID=A0AAN8UAX4_9MAGN
MASETQAKLPLIDFSNENLKPGSSVWELTRNKVQRALEEYGCFAAVYDKVSLELHNAVFSAAEELLNLPIETKRRNTSDRPYEGYLGARASVPLYDSSCIENGTTTEGIQKFTNLMWPGGNNHFSENMLAYAKLVAELDQMVKRMVFESYGVEKYYDSHISSTRYNLHPNKYRAPKANETNIGASSHTDKTFTSILHQNEVGGLEVKTRDGKWISCDFSPSSFVVMAGDEFLAWSNDRIYSPNHRVIMKEDKARYTMALFSYITGIINVPEELVDDDHPLKFKPFDHFGLVDFYYKDLERHSECTVWHYCAV